jgi:hypothetical protein
LISSHTSLRVKGTFPSKGVFGGDIQTFCTIVSRLSYSKFNLWVEEENTNKIENLSKDILIRKRRLKLRLSLSNGIFSKSDLEENFASIKKLGF